MKKVIYPSQFSFRLLVLVLLLSLVLAACGGGADATKAPASDTSSETAATEAPAAGSGSGSDASTGAPSYANDIQPILNASCSSCHGSRASGGVQLNSYDNLMGSNVVTAGDSAGSILWQVVDSGIMPQVGKRLSAEQVQKIADWINAGANND
jgi:mono/diheme cytochrome c family protein